MCFLFVCFNQTNATSMSVHPHEDISTPTALSLIVGGPCLCSSSQITTYKKLAYFLSILLCGIATYYGIACIFSQPQLVDQKWAQTNTVNVRVVKTWLVSKCPDKQLSGIQWFCHEAHIIKKLEKNIVKLLEFSLSPGSWFIHMHS